MAIYRNERAPLKNVVDFSMPYKIFWADVFFATFIILFLTSLSLFIQSEQTYIILSTPMNNNSTPMNNNEPTEHPSPADNKNQICIKIDWKIFFLIIMAMGAFASWYVLDKIKDGFIDKPIGLVNTGVKEARDIIKEAINSFKSTAKVETIIVDGEQKHICQFVTLQQTLPCSVKYTEDNMILPDRRIEISQSFRVKYGVDIAHLSIENNFLQTDGKWILRNLEGCVISVEAIGKSTIKIDDTFINVVKAEYVQQLNDDLEEEARKNAETNEFYKDLALENFEKIFNHKLLEIQKSPAPSPQH